ncbi:MAG: hypothetical protein ISR65_10755 [Bacteriovoracaceae bacterium]|nr:hypothetical protein [Candidatus Brocadiales bacterium]MBL6990251.1 hypothetical protein [Bacteriovoracaceae bacterium]
MNTAKQLNLFIIDGGMNRPRKTNKHNASVAKDNSPSLVEQEINKLIAQNTALLTKLGKLK